MKTLRHWCGRIAHASMSHTFLYLEENTEVPCNSYSCKCGWTMDGIKGVPRTMKPSSRAALLQIHNYAKAMKSGK